MKHFMLIGLCICTVSLAGHSALAEEEEYQDGFDAVESQDNNGVDMGVLESIDLIQRTAIVNGFRYTVGSAVNPVRVKMLGSNAGALELLSSGMHVRVTYRETPDQRIGMAIEQIKKHPEMDH